MLKKNQEMLKKAKAELMVITEAMSKNDNSVNVSEQQKVVDPVALLAIVDEILEHLNEAKAVSHGTSVTTITDNRTHDHETESSVSE